MQQKKYFCISFVLIYGRKDIWKRIISQNEAYLCEVDSMNGMDYVVKTITVLETKWELHNLIVLFETKTGIRTQSTTWGF